MRRLTALLAIALLAGCEEEKAPVNRIVLPAPIQAGTGTPDLSAFRKVYVDSESGQKLALFFVGDANGMSAQYVDANGLVDQSRLLSAEDSAGRKEGDPARDSSVAANVLLTRSGLPDRSFQVIPAQGGSLIQYNYGKLHYLSFVGLSGDTLKLGMRVDMPLLAKLTDAAGLGSSFRSLPALGNPGSKPGRLIFFTSAPAGLGNVLTENAAALFREVTGAESNWKTSDLAVPGSLSDTSSIEAIRLRVASLNSGEDAAGAADDANMTVEDYDATANAM
ncbi:hypothetical protein ACFQ1E_01430 [Sphingomonas canadensis]|uniref:Uncharacterized protein n=1 Tax=Sphingomonas canadensis TaxID=1219257 RepID=A0ABW3H0L8_9SPHN|nr:hypothetical protein [Sphingomonas canadensis]MCW3835097.1 hypothetical protein [Sphingomonas canadensis]